MREREKEILYINFSTCFMNLVASFLYFALKIIAIILVKPNGYISVEITNIGKYSERMMLIYCKCVCIEGAILEREKRKRKRGRKIPVKVDF